MASFTLLSKPAQSLSLEGIKALGLIDVILHQASVLLTLLLNAQLQIHNILVECERSFNSLRIVSTTSSFTIVEETFCSCIRKMWPHRHSKRTETLLIESELGIKRIRLILESSSNSTSLNTPSSILKAPPFFFVNLL